MLMLTEIVNKRRELKRDSIKNHILTKFYDKVLSGISIDSLSSDIVLIFETREDTGTALLLIREMLSEDSLEFNFKDAITEMDDGHIKENEIVLYYNLDKKF